MKKKIYIYAYTKLNLGDDLFIKILCDRYPKTIFYIMCSKDSSKALKDILNLRIIPKIPIVDGVLRRLSIKFSFNSIMRQLISKYCNAIVSIGGSMFIEDINWEYNSHQFAKRLIHNKPFFIIGSNFGPYTDEDFYNKYNKMFESISDICFRDEYSYNLFSGLPNVRLASDVVFSYNFATKITQQKNKQIVISVIDLENRSKLKNYNIIYRKKIIELARLFYSKGFSVYLMGFCQKEGDKKAILNILCCLTDEEKKKIIPYYYSGNLIEAIEVIQNSEFVIATRFHAMIIGWGCKKLVFPIVYSKKSLNVIKDVGFEGKFTTLRDINNILADEVYEYFTNGMNLDVNKQVDSAQLQFKKLDELLLSDKHGDS